MSETEKFVGKIQLKPRLKNETDKEYFERVTGCNWTRYEKYPPEDIQNAIYNNNITYYEAKRGKKGFMSLDNKNIYEILEIEQRDIEESYCVLEQLEDNIIKFEAQFYNGGTNLEEMIMDEFDSINKGREL